MDARTRLVEAAAQLLADSRTGDVSTRAVCEAAGVGAPTLYRQFGDKEGLLSAVVDYGFERYLASRRVAIPSDDPVQDLRDGWDAHTAFAIGNPAFYRLMYAPTVSTIPKSGREAHELLRGLLRRCAEAGVLTVPVETAAGAVMSANVGVALMLVSRPEQFPDPTISTLVRDATFASILTKPRRAAPAAPASELSTSAISLGAVLDTNGTTLLSTAEITLLGEWLHRLEAPNTPTTTQGEHS